VLLLLCFSATLFVGSMQLFLVQPMVAKGVLPLLGGTPAVWNTCMVFFQFALLAGYLYAHVGAKWLDARRQALAHIPVVLLSLLALPLVVAPTNAPTQGTGTAWWLLQALVTTVGIPFFVASTTAPILQRWFATTQHKSARDPYFLYAASNAGSLLALLAYPLAVEPTLRLGDQARLWSIGYGLLALLITACAVGVWRTHRAPETAVRESTPESRPGESTPPDTVRGSERLRWIALAFAPSSLLLGVTTFLTTDIAAVPLLWVAPLAIYLLTFVFVFSRRQIIPHATIVRALAILVLPVVIMLGQSTQLPFGMQLAVHLTTFFVAAMACHGELARSRPAPAHLTEFYLCMSIGGALGGLFNALVAPVAFSSVLEYPLALALACLLAIPYGNGWSARRLARDLAFAAVVAVVTASLLYASHQNILTGRLGTTVMFLIPALACFRFRRQPVRFALGVIVLVVASASYIDAHERLVHRDRSFFGVHRVTLDPSGERHLFAHGNTLHGGQHVAADQSRDPLTYFHRGSPIGQVVAARNSAGRLENVGVIGLGIGTLAAYGEPGQNWVFYEIDPAVERIARDSRYFTYLSDARANVSVVLGDARLSLIDARSAAFDLFVLDAFSSDAIPVHLITREALELYRDKLAPGGVMAFHISNRHLDLEPVLGELAASVGMTSLMQIDKDRAPTDAPNYKLSSHWVLMARSAADLEPFLNDKRWQPTRRSNGVVWTDDFSNVLSVMRWHVNAR
jgi:SAM-dependent methyltransferase